MRLAIKLMGVLLVLGSSSGLGFHWAGRYRCRLRQCRQLEQLLQRLLGEIRFHQLPLEEALRETGQAMEEPAISAFCRQVARGLADRMQGAEGCSLAALWSQEWNLFWTESCLGEEGELLETLGKELGALDLEAQIRVLQLCLERWREKTAVLSREEERYGRLYRGLGVAVGCFLSILLL